MLYMPHQKYTNKIHMQIQRDKACDAIWKAKSYIKVKHCIINMLSVEFVGVVKKGGESETV